MNTEQLKAQRTQFEAWADREGLFEHARGTCWKGWLASATASEGRVAELTAALQSIADGDVMRGKWKSTGPASHVETILAYQTLARAALAGSATPSETVADESLFDAVLYSIVALAHAATKHPEYQDAYSRLDDALEAEFARRNAATAPQDTLKNADSEDAARYRWLRMQNWFSSPLCVLRNPKEVLGESRGLGADCPSRERLDQAIDTYRTAAIESNRATLKEGPCKG